MQLASSLYLPNPTYLPLTLTLPRCTGSMEALKERCKGTRLFLLSVQWTRACWELIQLLT